MASRIILIFLTILIILGVSAGVIFYARGYRVDINNAKIDPTGILVATSDPDGAEVFINGKLTTATNNTINLAPGKYLVKIAKDGFNPWEKTVIIKAEEVFKTNAFLFPSLPELRPLTLTGAKNPVLSPDSTRIIYSVASASAQKNGLWILDMNRNGFASSFFSSADFRQIFQTDNSNYRLQWSPDNKEILASSSAKLTYLLQTDRINLNPLPLTPSQFASTITDWNKLESTRRQSQMVKLPTVLSIIFDRAGAKIEFSPDETKILYQATGSAVIPIILTTYLPGTNPTPESRDLKSGNYYVYDLKEDRNFLIPDCPNCTWFPSSRHLLSHSLKEISIMEYDGTNKAVIYAGPFKPNLVAAWPNWSKIVILTSLNTSTAETQNLYTINLR